MANYIVVMLVSGILLGVAFSGDPEGPLAMYGAFVILVLLLICVIYSAIALILAMKESCSGENIE
ncbi:MAG: hypothetical protein KDD45_07800 [Bdellovibrionales bacterium]|nr:hypothetical protein [Bdellovibrionales bacterium]